MPRVPALSRDEIGERMIRAVGIMLSAAVWRGKSDDVEGILSLADEFEDYVLNRDVLVDDPELVDRIRGKQK